MVAVQRRKNLRAAPFALSERYPKSRYIRPDFLDQCIVLSPHPAEVEEAYRNLFPSAIWVNISFHFPPEIAEYVRKRIQEFKSKNPSRAKSILRNLTEQLKSDPTLHTKGYIQNYLEKQGARTD